MLNVILYVDIANLFMSLVVERRVCFGCACVLTGLHALWIIPGLGSCSLAWEGGRKAMVEWWRRGRGGEPAVLGREEGGRGERS